MTRVCGNVTPTQPHTLGMWSWCLGGVPSTSCGDLCTWVQLEARQCKCDTRVLDHRMEATRKLAKTLKVIFSGTTCDMLTTQSR